MKFRVIAIAALVPLGLLTGSATAASPTAALSCKTHVASDFNGDGYADVATGDFVQDDGESPGGVQIDYGSATGVNPTKAHFLNEATPGVPGDPTYGGRFGFTLVSGYFNDDCYADLAIGNPSDEDHSGSVTILYGSKHGLTTTNAQRFVGPDSSYFSTSLAGGDFNHDGRDDLAVGARGKIAVLYGGKSQIGAPSIWITAAGMNTDIYSMAAGDFNGDGFADLAAGAPTANVNGKFSGGLVKVYYGSGHGITTTGSKTLTQETAGIPGSTEASDAFGVNLAAGDVNGDGRADLVVGVSGESVGTIKGTGDIVYIPGTRSGLTGAGSMRFSQSTAGVPGVAQPFDSAGTAVAVGDLNGDGYADIVFGIPVDVVLTGAKVGSVIVLRGTKSGPTATGAVRLSEKTPGVPGGAPALSEFGSALHTAYVHGGKQADLLVGAFQQNDEGYAVVIPGIADTGPTGAGAREIGLAADNPGSVYVPDFGWTFG